MASKNKSVQRGYREKDQIEFGDLWQEKLNHGSEELYYLLDHGYKVKTTSTFIGNHYGFSERQRLALVRIISCKKDLEIRKNKEISVSDSVKCVAIDGFNTIITLEVALSGSMLIQGMDGTIRDLAGLRGTYRIIDKTQQAIELILKTLDQLEVLKAIIYLDQPVSNSGRLKTLIKECASHYKVEVIVEVIPNVDSVLEKLEAVISSDAIILNKCKSWFNLNTIIINQYINDPWIFKIE